MDDTTIFLLGCVRGADADGGGLGVEGLSDIHNHHRPRPRELGVGRDRGYPVPRVFGTRAGVGIEGIWPGGNTQYPPNTLGNANLLKRRST